MLIIHPIEDIVLLGIMTFNITQLYVRSHMHKADTRFANADVDGNH